MIEQLFQVSNQQLVHPMHQHQKLLNPKPQKKMMKTTKYKPHEFPKLFPKLFEPLLDSIIFFVYTAFDVYDNVILSVRHYITGNSFITNKFICNVHNAT